MILLFISGFVSISGNLFRRKDNRMSLNDAEIMEFYTSMAILEVEGIDVSLIGPNDLSISMGIRNQMDSEILTKGIDKLV